MSDDIKNDELLVKHTMRSAFKRWLILHDEEYRSHGYIKIPYWFRYYIRDNKEWSYQVVDDRHDWFCNKCEMDYDSRRVFNGFYSFEISDEELINLKRPKWIKAKHLKSNRQKCVE